MPLSSIPPDRRTNSSVCLQELTNPRERSRSQTYPTPHDVVGVTRPTRFRRSSFALSGERQTALDNLVDSASREATIAAAAQEAAALSALVSPHPESAMLARDDGLDSKRVSVSTIVAGQSGSSAVFHSAGPVDKSGLPSVHYPPGRKVAVCEISTENDDLYPWHDSGCPHSSLLNSEVIQNYLATLAVDNDVEECEQSPKLSTVPVAMTCENVPGLFRESVASMTMPVHQIRRAHWSASIPQRVTEHPRSNRPVKSMRYDLPHFPTDFTSSSCASDAEGWPSVRGYMSDNPIDEADPRAKQLRLTGQRLEADFHRTKSLPRSPKTKRTSPSKYASIAEALVGYGSAPTSHVSNFDLSHVYDGLPSPKAALSTNSLNFETFRSTLTPPSTPASSRSVSSMDPDSGGSVNNGFGRIISLFGPFKPKPANDNPESYIYMDEETSERRTRALASNLISPVSF
ncbi:hypothetical protein CSKR_109196 [Clonorchis sinensis]|uniref:Uncharacterized protein n=1 Tax=Clonorchis sinensis TaxID=79923 RepID=A0A3R7H4G5_CLOSI|nr:hypothetical protein CSKR_109196 [Clonorchis sinensis]